MGDSYDKALEAVRQLRELGATRVRVGEVEVEFPPLLPAVVDPWAEATTDYEEENPLDQRKRWEEEQYHSASPIPPELMRRLTGRRQ